MHDFIFAQLPPEVQKMVEPEPKRKPKARRRSAPARPKPPGLPRATTAIPVANTAAKAGQAWAVTGPKGPSASFGKRPGLGRAGGVAARGVSGVGGALKTYKGAQKIGKGVTTGDTLETWEGATDVVGGSSAMAAAAGVGGPAAPLLAAGIGVAQRGEDFAKEHFDGRGWSDLAAEAGHNARSGIAESTGSEALGEVVGFLTTAGASAVLGVGALATGAAGVAGDVLEGAGTLVTGAGEVIDAIVNGERRPAHDCPSVKKKDQWDPVAKTWVARPPEPKWASDLTPAAKEAMNRPLTPSPGPSLGTSLSQEDIDAVLEWSSSGGGRSK